MSLQAFVERAWHDHADAPERVADNIANSVPLLASAADVAPFARLLTHVYGEHLGRWDDGVTLLESIREANGMDDVAARRALDRSIATLRYAAGDEGPLAALPVEERIASLATASSALAGRYAFKRAITAFDHAISLAHDGVPAGSPAIRDIAIGGNNLAAALEEKSDRDSGETHGMLAAAEAGLRFWKLAGTWLEEERAEYRLARSLLQAGDVAAAAQHARACIALCETNDAPPIERFVGHVVLALAQQASDRAAYESSRREALRLYALASDDERQACEAERAELA